MKTKGNTDKEVIITQAYVPVAEEITVNLKQEEDGNSSKRYLKAAVSIGFDSKDKKVAKELEQKAIEIKDKTLFYLKSRTIKDFDANNEEKLKKGLVDEINNLLVEGKIIDVYFDNILTQ